MLYRREVVHLVIIRHNDHSARVLRRGALYSGAADGKTLHLGVVEFDPTLLAVLLHKAVCGLVLYCGNGACLEYMVLAEEFFCIAMYLTLDFTREVQVDIRRLIALESEERFERDIMAVAYHINSAVRAVLLGEVKSGADGTVRYELVVTALGAAVMRRQRIYL